MKTVETILPVGEIINMEKLPDGSWRIKQMVSDEATPKKAMPSDEATPKKATSIPKNTILDEPLYRCVEAESLSLDDEFMKHSPRTKREKETKDLIKEVIDKGVKNFYRPIMDPSFTETGENIRYEKGGRVAAEKSYYWWERVAKKYCPERNSRIGTRLQYGAFLGVFIKNLVAEGKSVSWAWNAVCNDSEELGHYLNCEDAKLGYERTGSRQICEYYDLANTRKILAENNGFDGFWLASGSRTNFSSQYPIADLDHCTGRDCNIYFATGWLVLS